MDNKIASIPSDKINYLIELAKLRPETLAILVEMARRPGVEDKLKAKAKLLMMFI